MNPRRSILIVFGVALLFPATRLAFGQANDPLVGAWLLSRGKSDFTPPLAFFKRTMIIDAADGGYKCTIRTVSDRQQTFESTYTARLDGKDVPIDNSTLDTMSLRRIDANGIESTGKIKGQAVENATMRVSADGKVLTITTKGSLNGEEYSSIQIFNRQ